MTFPQEFQISKSIGQPISGSGGKKTFIPGELPAVHPAAGRVLPAAQDAAGPAAPTRQGQLVFRRF